MTILKIDKGGAYTNGPVVVQWHNEDTTMHFFIKIFTPLFFLESIYLWCERDRWSQMEMEGN